MTAHCAPSNLNSASFDSHSRSPINAQRAAFREAQAAIKAGNEARARQIQRTSLKGYPLNIYIDYAILANKPSLEKYPQALRFVQSGNHGELSLYLKQVYADFMGDRGRYKDVAAIIGPQPYAEGQARLKSQKELLCRFHEANWHIGRGTGAAVAYAAAMYSDLGTMPPGCSGLVSTWASKGYLTDAVKFRKFTNAFRRNKTGGKAASLARELKGTKFGSAVNTAMRYRDRPAKFFTSGSKDRVAATLIMERLATMDPDEAVSKLPLYTAQYHPSRVEVTEVKQVIAAGLMGRTRSAADVAWADRNLDQAGWTEDLILQRLRRAIWFADWKVADRMIKRLSPEVLSEVNWHYWQGRVAIENGRKNEGRRILEEVARDRSFFGFLAAQTVGRKAAFNEMKLPAKADLNVALNRNPAVRRFFELHALNDRNASVEWREVAKTSTDEDALIMADWALRNGLSRYAIDSVVASNRWDALAYRFPAPYMDIYKRNSQNQGVALSFLYGISRQESMMNPTVRSPVGAVGLMQLMPGTAKLVSRQNHWKYNGTASLTDPSTNVRLGTAYLKDMLGKFGNNRVLAAAAYNAGPHRVYRWASNDGIKRDTAMYVENIPFDETRKYVQNVLLYDTIYNKLLNNREEQILKGHELSYRY